MLATLTQYGNTILILGAIAGAVAYAWTQSKASKAKALKEKDSEANEAEAKVVAAYKDLFEAQKLKIEELERKVNEFGSTIHVLQGKIEILTEQNSSLESIVHNALIFFWEKHPELAKEVEIKTHKKVVQ